jgi:transposase-like protein
MLETPIETANDGPSPRCPRCGAPNDVWQFRQPHDGEWYRYVCGGCGRAYEWQIRRTVRWKSRPAGDMI